MKLFSKKLFYFLPLVWLLACSSDDDSTPTTSDLIKAHSWRVNNYDVNASSGGVSISQDLLAPFVDEVLDEAPLNGIITFEDNTFTIDDQGTIIDGTWSLSNDESEITMTFTVAAEAFTFQIQQITSDNFDLSYTATENFNLANTSVSVSLEITGFLVPA